MKRSPSLMELNRSFDERFAAQKKKTLSFRCFYQYLLIWQQLRISQETPITKVQLKNCYNMLLEFNDIWSHNSVHIWPLNGINFENYCMSGLNHRTRIQSLPCDFRK